MTNADSSASDGMEAAENSRASRSDDDLADTFKHFLPGLEVVEEGGVIFIRDRHPDR